MSNNKIIISSVLVIILGSTSLFFFNKRNVTSNPSQVQTASSTIVVSTSSTTILTTASSVPVFPHDVKYLADGTVDTSDWQEYRSEYGGFSVRAPKGDSSIGGCMGKGCEPARDGEKFYYILAPTEGGGVPGMGIYVIKKDKGTNIDTWMDSYIVSGNEYISSVQKTIVQSYPTLQFDVHVSDMKNLVMMKKKIYPSGYENNIENIGGYSGLWYHCYVIELGDRYLVLSYSTHVDGGLLLKSLGDIGPLTPKSFDNKALTNIYKAIFDSLIIFTPTKK